MFFNASFQDLQNLDSSYFSKNMKLVYEKCKFSNISTSKIF